MSRVLRLHQHSIGYTGDFALKLTISSYSIVLLPSTVVTIGLCWSEFLYFLFNANISYAAAVAGDSDDSDVVVGDASYVSSSSLLLLSAMPVNHNASV